VAGLCVWIFGWEDDEEDVPPVEAPAGADPPAEAKRAQAK
jgi:hypothetical protein